MVEKEFFIKYNLDWWKSYLYQNIGEIKLIKKIVLFRKDSYWWVILVV